MGITTSLRSAVIPEVGTLQSQSKPASRFNFVFRQYFTKQALYGLAENKNHPPFGGWFALSLRREGDSNPRYPFEVHTLSRRAS
jgi:hypothetical protein